MKCIRIVGKVAFVELTRGLEAKIDTADISLIKGRSWHVIPNPMGGFYAHSGDGYMHRVITKCPRGKEVDHLNHDTLDNRRKNLAIGSHKKNMANGKFALATHCPKGHPYDGDNLYFDGRSRRCKKCNAERVSAIYASETRKEREARRQRAKGYYERTREIRLAQMKVRAETHKEEKREYDRLRRIRLKALKGLAYG